jgi:uncharacterized membrane protein
MAQFNPEDYETVEARLKRAHELYPDMRVITTNLTTLQDRQVNTWVVQATIYLTADEQLHGLAKATGLAFEVDGMNGMANKTSALENCETSAIGRCLANMNMSGNKRTSREEMEKVQRGVTPQPARDWSAEIAALPNIDAARALYNDARGRRAGADVLKAIEAKVATFAPTADK